MTSKSIKNILIKKGVTHLYHANTVATACTYIRNHGLLSRGAVDELGLYQTPQETDELDKECGVYYDIFFDSVDIHQRCKRLNYYGPVMFVYSIDVLDVLPQDIIRITKDNPIRWNAGMQENERYFLDEDELITGYTRGDFGQHLTLRHQTTPLSFDFLEKIIIDDPAASDTGYFMDAFSCLKNLVDIHIQGIPLEVRQCEPDCNCKNQYSTCKEGYIYYRFGIK